MKYLKKFFEHGKVSLFNPEWIKLLPEQLTIITQNGEFNLKRKNEIHDTMNHPVDVSNILNCIQINYYHNTVDDVDGDVLADGEPDYLTFDITLVKNNSGESANPDTLRLTVDIAYGDQMQYEFTIEKPNIVKVLHYTGKNSLYDKETYFGFSDESLEKLVEFFNRFGFKTTLDDFKFIDKDPDSYQYVQEMPDGDLTDMTKSDNEEIWKLKGGNRIQHYHKFQK